MTQSIDELMTLRPEVVFDAALTPRHVTEFNERGFTWIERITSDEELQWLGAVYDRLFAERVEPVPGGYIDLIRPYDSAGEDLQPQILLPELRFAELRKTAFWRNGRTLAARLLGVERSAVRGWGHMILKPPRIGGPLPWHQDEAYWDPAFDYQALGCWMPLDPATPESGCMRFIPGSHRGAVREHRHLGDNPAVHATYAVGVDDHDAVAVPIAAGGAIFHNCRIVHSSLPNRSERVRRAYANEWQVEPVRRQVPHDRPWMTDGTREWDKRDIGSARGARKS